MADWNDPAIRRTYLGGSDVAAMLGISPWKSPLALFMEKTGEIAPADLSDNEAVQWGIILEEPIAQAYQRKTGNTVRRWSKRLTHPVHDFIAAHLDRRIVGKPIILECKATSEYQAGAWGDEWTDQVPAHYRAQCLHYLLVTGAEEIHLAVLIGGNKHRTYCIRAADVADDIANLLQAELAFWARVQAKVPPNPESTADLLLLYPSPTKAGQLADDMDIQTAADLSACKQQMDQLAKLKALLETRLQASMADHESLDLPDGRSIATWKATSSRRIDTKALRAAHPDIASAFEVTSTSRRFVLKAKVLIEGEDDE